MEVETITQEAETETRLQKALLEEEEQLTKDDAFDYLTGVAHTTSGRFVANEITADVCVSYRPQREYDTEGRQKIKELEEQLSQAKCRLAASRPDLGRDPDTQMFLTGHIHSGY